MSAPDPRPVSTTGGEAHRVLCESIWKRIPILDLTDDKPMKELIAEIAVLRRALWAVYDECDEEPDIEWNGYRDVDRKAKRIKALLREALEWKR